MCSYESKTPTKHQKLLVFLPPKFPKGISCALFVSLLPETTHKPHKTFLSELIQIMGDFQGVSEKFYVRLLSDGGNERVVCQVGLDGLQISAVDSGRTLRKYPLNHIARWAAQGTSLMLYTKTPSDVEERTFTLQADETTIRSLLDTLTCCCMQYVLMALMNWQSVLCNTQLLTMPTQDGRVAHIQRSQQWGCRFLVQPTHQQETHSGMVVCTIIMTSSPHPHPIHHHHHRQAIPTADEVEFWKDPEKTGWMHSQGEHIKTWRRRWFVLKQGFLYRFSSDDVNASSKPRGVVDLSKVTDVKDGRSETGRPNSLKLSTAAGKVCYICDTETELVEWMSALEGTVNKLVKRAAGIEDEEPPKRSAAGSNGAAKQQDWTRQLENSFSAMSSSVPARKSSSSSQQQLPSRATVTIVGYGDDRPAAQPAVEDFNYGGLNYSSIAGVAGVSNYQAPTTVQGTTHAYGGPIQQQEPLLHVDYGAYPVPPVQPAGGATGGADAYAPQYGHYMQQLTQPVVVQQQQEAAAPAYGGGAAVGGDAWQVHYTAEGQAYYHNAATGITQWEAPAGMA